MSNTTSLLEEVADRLAILELYARYVHAGDDGRMDLLDEVFLPDTMLDYTDAGGPKCDWTAAKSDGFFRGEQFEHVFHINVNHVIDFDEGRASARVRSKTFNPWGRHTTAGEPALYQVQGGHSDRLVRTEAGWRIVERVWKTDWVSGWIGGGFRFVNGVAEMVE